MIILSALRTLSTSQVKQAATNLAFVGAVIAKQDIETHAQHPADAYLKLATVRKQLVELDDETAATGRLSCILAAHIYKMAGVDESAQMPSYHLLSDVAGNALPAAYVRKVAAAVNASIGRHYLDMPKVAGAGLSAMMPVLSGAAALTPDTLKVIAGLAVLTGAAGGAGIFKANEASAPDAADAEKLRRQAAVYRQMRHDIDQEMKTRGLLSVQQT